MSHQEDKETLRLQRSPANAKRLAEAIEQAEQGKLTEHELSERADIDAFRRILTRDGGELPRPGDERD